MYSKAKIAGHPIHPMLTGFPTTFYFLTLVGFVIFRAVSPDVFWYKLGYFSNFAAIVTALVTAVPGIMDWAMGIPKGSVAKKHGRTHMILQLVNLALFALSASIIAGNWDNPTISLTGPILLSGVGCLVLLGGNYYGWDLVSHHKVGIQMSPDQEHLQERYEQEEPPLFH